MGSLYQLYSHEDTTSEERAAATALASAQVGTLLYQLAGIVLAERSAAIAAGGSLKDLYDASRRSWACRPPRGRSCGRSCGQAGRAAPDVYFNKLAALDPADRESAIRNDNLGKSIICAEDNVDEVSLFDTTTTGPITMARDSVSTLAMGNPTGQSILVDNAADAQTIALGNATNQSILLDNAADAQTITMGKAGLQQITLNNHGETPDIILGRASGRIHLNDTQSTTFADFAINDNDEATPRETFGISKDTGSVEIKPAALEGRPTTFNL